MTAPDQKPFPFRLEFPPELPISARAEEIVATIQAHPVVILAGETGSGKTTQIPKMCLAAGRGTQGRIACTQPRRVAALSISRRVAEEMNVTWGREVGAKIRFTDQTTPETVIKFLTDGMLLAEVQGDPLLRAYDTIIIDEAHERSLNIDFLLGHLRTLRYKRPELKIIVTSATIDTEAFSKAFDGAPIVEVSGRTYPVEVIYAPLDSLGSDAAEGDERASRAEALHYIDGAVEAVERIVRESDRGDVLVFMPSERDIRETRELLDGRRLKHCETVPLFGRLSNAEQQRVFAPSPRRKIIVATNIAETSLTIPGIRFVVDTGLARVSRYAAQARTRRLPIEAIAQSSADQRKGRAGRVAEGVCIRLYSEKDFNERPRFAQPEIQRANLADVILRMKAFGLGDIERFPFINMPATKAIRAGYALLEELGAIARGESVDSGQWTVDTGQVPSAHAVPSSVHRLPSTELTAVGRVLARLPVDPTVGRMILQARSEKCVREALVIAAGLSIQDPRERPLDKQQQADAAHRRFAHPDSDFLTLLNIWEDYHDEFERLSQSRQRRFCHEHFLSYTRMREWRDIHAQLLDTLEQREDFQLTSVFDGLPNSQHSAERSDTLENPTPRKRQVTAPNTLNSQLAFGTPAYRALHRSILAGLLGNIAVRDDEHGGYKATHDRRVTIFPGSMLFQREDPKKRGTDAGKRPAPKKESKTPRWLMAAEIMETSRLYARTCARLDPQWALELGAHLVKVAHSEPFWNVDAGRVMVKQRTRLYGLELESRSVGYGRIDPVHATEIFIREGLVNDTITWPFDFLAHNRAVREKIENLLTRTRDSGYLNLDEAAYRFYASRLMPPAESEISNLKSQIHAGPAGVTSVAELIDLVRERKAAEPRFLMMEPDDLRDPETLQHDAEAFPEALPLENTALPLAYAYKPGQGDDGVTLDVHVREAEALTPTALDWAVPGHLEPKVVHYLRALPKELRRVFMPLAETARSLAAQVARRDRLTGRRESLTESLAAQIAERFQVRLDPAVWTGKPPPDHLRVRVRVLDDEGDELCASRELAEIHAALAVRAREASTSVAREDPTAWRQARARWEKPDQTDWTFGEIPERVHVTDQAGVPVFAFPALKAGGEGVALRLCKTPEEAAALTPRGLSRLLELALRYELAWLQKDLRALRELGTLTATLAPVEQLQADGYDCIRRWICDAARVGRARPPGGPSAEAARAESAPHLGHAAFSAAVERAKADLRGLMPRFADLLREILALRQALLVHPTPYAGLDKDLAALLPPDFVRTTAYPQLQHFPRYLKAMRLRSDRWKQNAVKDAERTRQLAPYVKAAAEVRAREGGDVFRWLVEELRVSVFAQELGTAEPVSTVKLDRALAALRAGARPKSPAEALPESLPPVVPAPGPAPIVSAPVARPAEKKAPLKSLNALDNLFKR
ncbi:MAG TPA: ATP-dependent RNA helicase HrpA [Opitutaceae bacterium]